MDKALLTDLKKKMFIRSALVSLPSLDEILGLNDYLSPDEILLEIIKKSLREFEDTIPLVLDMRVTKGQLDNCCNSMPGYSEIKSNFSLYLDCIIPEGSIILVPNSIPKWRSYYSYPQIGAYQYVTDYRRPYLFTGDLPGGMDIFYLRGICSRPIVPDWTPDKKFNPNSDRSAVYWMNIEEGTQGAYFLDLCMMNLLDFIRQMKASLQIPNVGVDVFGNVDTAYMELRQRCEQYAIQSSWSGDLLV